MEAAGRSAAGAVEDDGDYQSPLLAVHRGRAVCLLFNGILGDRPVSGGNVRTRPVIQALTPHEGPKANYGASRRVSEVQQRLRVVLRDRMM